MAALTAILKALSRVVKRDLGTFLSVKLNNFFLFGVLLVWGALVGGMEPIAAIPYFSLLGFLLLFPLSSDPLNKVPASRLALWPLTSGERWGLRIASLGLSPITWLVLFILIATRNLGVALLFFVVAFGAQSLSILGDRVATRIPRLNPLRNLPQLPGRFGGLIRHNLRQLLSVLDFYVALLFSIAATAYRWLGAHPEPAAFPILAMLVGLALSTYAQCSFGLDSGSGLSRYHLLPLRGWQVLIAKDAAFLIVLSVLVLPLSPGAGLTFALAAVAIGRYPSLALHLAQQRWRFTGGDIRFGVLQILAGTTLGFLEYQHEPWFFILGIVAYLASLYVGGRYWDLRRNP